MTRTTFTLGRIPAARRTRTVSCSFDAPASPADPRTTCGGVDFGRVLIDAVRDRLGEPVATPEVLAALHRAHQGQPGDRRDPLDRAARAALAAH